MLKQNEFQIGGKKGPQQAIKITTNKELNKSQVSSQSSINQYQNSIENSENINRFNSLNQTPQVYHQKKNSNPQTQQTSFDQSTLSVKNDKTTKQNSLMQQTNNTFYTPNRKGENYEVQVPKFCVVQQFSSQQQNIKPIMNQNIKPIIKVKANMADRLSLTQHRVPEPLIPKEQEEFLLQI